MADVDPETLLEWLQMGSGDERDMQLIALEQLCMLLLMSDNVDRCFEMYVYIRTIARLYAAACSCSCPIMWTDASKCTYVCMLLLMSDNVDRCFEIYVYISG